MKVKLLRPIYPYKSWEIIEIDNKKYEYFKWQVEQVAEVVEKEVKKKRNKAVLKNKNTKW